MSLIVMCDYCTNRAEFVSGRDVYPHRQDLWTGVYYRCVPCKARVGCHPGTSTPLGRLANQELRKAKSAAHRAFDPIWKDGPMRRKQAYGWLAARLGIPVDKCHIGMFDEETCQRVVDLCKATTFTTIGQ